jgi:hypothetical protein
LLLWGKLFCQFHKYNLFNILFYLIAYLFSGVYEDVTAKSRQILLKQQANFIAEYEALHHIHFSNPESETNYIYHIGQPKNFREWLFNRKGYQGEIYKDFEVKPTNTTQAFIDVDYDGTSIWNFDDDNSSDTKGKKKEDSTDSTIGLPKIEEGTIPSNSLENSQGIILEKINEKINEIMKKVNDDIQNLVFNEMYTKFNNVHQNSWVV